MKLEEMSPEAQAGRRLFIETLSAAGWGIESWDALLTGGGDVDPEAEATHSAGELELQLAFHAAGPFLDLQLATPDDHLFLSLRLYPADDLGALLRQIVARQETLTAENMPDLVKTLIPLCNPLLIETEEGLQQLSL